MNMARTGNLREHISAILTRAPRSSDHLLPLAGDAFGAVLRRLRQVPPDDLDAKLRASGLTDHPAGQDQKRCQECMYFLLHKSWCDLPEMEIPVEPDWHCRLWQP